MSGIGYLLRETAAREIRLRVEPWGPEVPEGAYEIWTMTRHGHGTAPGDDDKMTMGKRDVGLMELLVPRQPRILPNGRPCMWWTFERKIGEKTIIKKSKGEFIDVLEGVYDSNWKEAAGSLVDVMTSMAWVYEAAVIGETLTPRGAWLVCEDCDEPQMLPKNLGSPSSPRKCHMTPRCEGFARRLDLVISVNAPKVLKHKPESIKRTAGAERMRKKLGIEVESPEIDVDNLNAA